MLDYWLTKGCTWHSFERIKTKPEIERHHEFLEKWDCKFPFVHGITYIKDKWFGEQSWGLDPLLVPILRHLNNMNGVQTYTSCQGSKRHSPSIGFFADEKSLDDVSILMRRWTIKTKRGCYWDQTVLNYEGKRCKEYDRRDKGIGNLFPTWNLLFYDTLALIKFTEEELLIPIEQQLRLKKVKYLYPRKERSEGPSAREIRMAIWGDNLCPDKSKWMSETELDRIFKNKS